jgi:hypothetical protein
MELYHRAPTGESNVQDDPKAREMLRRANERTYRWPKGFGGFSADLVCTQAGKISKGRVEIKSARDVQVILDDDALQKWAEGQIGMMAIHRSARPFEEADGRFKLTLGEDDHHPLGQLILIHGDGMGSRYRVKEDRITQINRNMEKIRFTINVDGSLTTTDARFLTTRYTVYYFIPADGRLINVESFSDNHEVVEEIYLLGTRRVSFAEDGQVITRTLNFKNHRLL